MRKKVGRAGKEGETALETLVVGVDSSKVGCNNETLLRDENE